MDESEQIRESSQKIVKLGMRLLNQHQEMAGLSHIMNVTGAYWYWFEVIFAM